MSPARPAHTRDPLSAALEATLARYADKLRWVARDSRLSPDEVDELLQDVRIRLWRALDQGERIAAVPTSYVHRTVQSAVIDLIRKRRGSKEERLDPGRPGPPPAVVTVEGPERAVADRELGARITQAVEGLSDTRRPVVRMYLAGYRGEEIATRLGWTEPRTRNLLYRGLTELRERLTQMNIGPEGER